MSDKVAGRRKPNQLLIITVPMDSNGNGQIAQMHDIQKALKTTITTVLQMVNLGDSGVSLMCGDPMVEVKDLSEADAQGWNLG